MVKILQKGCNSHKLCRDRGVDDEWWGRLRCPGAHQHSIFEDLHNQSKGRLRRPGVPTEEKNGNE